MMVKQYRAKLWILSSIALALLFVAVIAHAVVRIPVPFNDNFSEIAKSYRIPLAELLRNEFLDPGPYFRPFEIVWRWLISHGLQQGIFGYGLFTTIWLVLVVVSFALVCHPRSAREFTAFLVSLAVLVGHHAMQGALEFNIVFSNGIALLVGILAIALIANTPTFWGQVAAILLTVVCLLTKEVGLVVAWVFVIAHLLRMPGIRRSTAVIIVAIVAVYVCFHFYTLPPLK